jgi:hypothetical protein
VQREPRLLVPARRGAGEPAIAPSMRRIGLDRDTVVRGTLAILLVAVVGVGFIASYAGALHDPIPHDVALAVAGPPRLAASLEKGDAFRVHRVADAAAALRDVDERKAYGAVVAGGDGESLRVVVAPAASPVVADVIRSELVPPLRGNDTPVTVTTVHPLPDRDVRGIVPFYVAVGWVVAGYLGATLLGLGFGTRPGLAHVGRRLGALAALGVLVGVGGALTGRAIGGFGGSWLGTGAVGALTVFAVGATTVALQAVMGILGTGVALLIFVVLGNPSSGGPFATELLPGPWRAVGPLIPTGAAVTSVRDLAYFPHASLMGPLLVLVAWGAAGAAVAGLVGGRRTERSEAEGSMAAAAAP